MIVPAETSCRVSDTPKPVECLGMPLHWKRPLAHNQLGQSGCQYASRCCTRATAKTTRHIARRAERRTTAAAGAGDFTDLLWTTAVLTASALLRLLRAMVVVRATTCAESTCWGGCASCALSLASCTACVSSATRRALRFGAAALLARRFAGLPFGLASCAAASAPCTDGAGWSIWAAASLPEAASALGRLNCSAGAKAVVCAQT